MPCTLCGSDHHDRSACPWLTSETILATATLSGEQMYGADVSKVLSGPYYGSMCGCCALREINCDVSCMLRNGEIRSRDSPLKNKVVMTKEQRDVVWIRNPTDATLLRMGINPNESTS